MHNPTNPTEMWVVEFLPEGRDESKKKIYFAKDEAELLKQQALDAGFSDAEITKFVKADA